MSGKAPAGGLAAALPGARQVHVGFTDSPRGGWLRLLKPGFRHCLAVVEGTGWWLVVDPLASHLHLAVTRPAADASPAERLAAHGFAVAVLPAPTAPGRSAPWAPLTCVEVVKRLLGLHAPTVLTPWALYRHLRAAGAQIREAPSPDANPEASHGFAREELYART